jgi:DNA-binding CsgD family transcriptional regulator/PAS domain-containing protein
VSRDLTETIYAAVHATDLWPVVASELARTLGSPTVVAASELTSGPWRRTDFTVKAAAGAASHCLSGLIRRQAQDFIGPMEEVSPDLTASRPALRDGDGQDVGQWLHVMGHLNGGTRLCHVAAARGVRDKPFGEEEVGRFFDLAKHVLRATSICERLGQEVSERIWRDAIDAMNVGICVVAEDGSLIKANTEGKRLLDQGRHVAVVNSRLRLVQPEKAVEFQSLLTELADSGRDRGAVLSSDEEGGGFVVGLVRSGGRDGDGEQRGGAPVIVYMGEIDKDYRRLEGVLRQAFRLTRMEARTTVAVLRGIGIDEAAKTLGLAPATVRSHVKNVFSKTGVQRQSQLVHRTLGGVLSLLA